MDNSSNFQETPPDLSSQSVPNQQPQLDAWLQAALQGDVKALGELLDSHSSRIRRMIELRMDVRLRARVNPSDVLQETLLDATRRLSAYGSNPSLPFFVWLRFLAQQRLIDLYRVHLGADMRSVDRESPIGFLAPSNGSAAHALTSRLTSASHAVMRAELQERVQAALEAMAPIDREILVLRHYELLTNAESAVALGLSKTSASNRYVRALLRLKQLIGQDVWDLLE